MSKDKRFTHTETEKPDEAGVWQLVSTEGGRDTRGKLKIKKVIRKTVERRRVAPAPEKPKPLR